MLLPTQSTGGFICVISINFHNHPHKTDTSDFNDKETGTQRIYDIHLSFLKLSKDIHLSNRKRIQNHSYVSPDPKGHPSHFANCQQFEGCLSQKMNSTVKPLHEEIA